MEFLYTVKSQSSLGQSEKVKKASQKNQKKN